ncbi:TPA: SIS domain-containing protein [Streptococcus suis]
MFQFSTEELEQLGAEITTREIKQQPDLWKEALALYKDKQAQIDDFIGQIFNRHEQVKIILTGAGTSAYVGDTLLPFLKQVTDARTHLFESVPTTDLVSNPYAFYQEDQPTLLISFARSGNSPESVAAVELGQALVKDFYQLTITCAPEGKLAQKAQGDPNNLVLLQPAGANDQGFAMTGSYSCMLLTCALVFDPSLIAEKEAWVQTACQLGQSVIEREADLQALLEGDIQRVIYLGSGPFAGLARETQLKILELTAGKIATNFDSSMGFRHGPKSFVDGQSLALVYVSNHPYTRQYDVDIINELAGDQIAKKVVAITVQGDKHFDKADSFDFDSQGQDLPDIYLALPYVMVGQTISLLASIKVDNKPDTPSPSGTVNRVVKGVTIHQYQA